MTRSFEKLNYDPTKLDRELKPHYISMTSEEEKEMMDFLGIKELSELYSHLPQETKFAKTPEVCERLEYSDLIDQMESLANKNNQKTTFIGDGLMNYKVGEMADYVCSLRGLGTAYTPYQPERSQGTLSTLWLYSSTLAQLTGFEAINASMYERSTCLFEALLAGMKLTRKSDTVVVCGSMYPGDLEVLSTIDKGHPMNIIVVPYNKETGVTDIAAIKEAIEGCEGKVGALAFPQVNCLGNLEDVNALTDLATELKIQSIAVIDPMLLATEGLIPPSDYGSESQGCDMIVGEGQHLAIGPNYGGPGLGIFGIRYNPKKKLGIRQTPGRYVGKAKDEHGRDALCMVLSTREQHIRRDKATSNICSNQSFIATVAGAAILERGEIGMTDSCLRGRDNAIQMAVELSKFEGVSLTYPEVPFYNQFVLTLPTDVDAFIAKASEAGVQVGVNVSDRTDKPNQLLLSFTDIHSDDDLDKLIDIFEASFGAANEDIHEAFVTVPDELLRDNPVGLPNFSLDELKAFYSELDKQNVSPDNIIYPLGSCTMKYNPFINEWAAWQDGFANVHPQSPVSDVQGSLEVLYEVQEMFKRMLGMPAIALQPLAGAQGEFAGLKMFQAYHESNGEDRDIILIPHSAHGTNPATATAAGFETKTVDGKKVGIVLVEANCCGQIDIPLLKAQVEEYGNRIAGIMVTNPNTSGVFETEFKEMADLIHSVGGLVYMDGANLNAIAGWVDLGAMGVDACHSNLHKTFSIPHGGGGPGDAIVVVSEKLKDFIPGSLVKKTGDKFELYTTDKSIGSLHRHHGNFGHKIRTYTYLRALGSEGIKRMSAIAVLSARYLYKRLKDVYPMLPAGCDSTERMHEFILTITEDDFARIADAGTPKANAIAKIGKLFLDFGLHAPTVAFPEVYGLMVEPTESFSKAELDRFADVIIAMKKMIAETPEVLTTTPHFMPVSKVDEVTANKNLILSEKIEDLPKVLSSAKGVDELQAMKVEEIVAEILKAHQASK